MTQNNALAPAYKKRMGELNAYLSKMLPTINAVLPKHMTGERLVRIVAAAASRQPELLECTPISIIQAVVVASQMGLEPVGPLGQAYLVPYKNSKNGKKEAQLIPGYRGMIELARRSGNIVNIEAHVVHDKDEFAFCFGLDPKLEHKPYMGEGDAGKTVAVYAIARFRDGGYQTDVMTISEIKAIQDRSKASGFGPWKTDFDEMARKTVVKRLCKYLPLSVELANAVAADNAAEVGLNQLDALDVELPDGMTIDTEVEPAKTKSEAIAEKLAAKPESESQNDEIFTLQSAILDLIGTDAGLGLNAQEQADYIVKHTGKQLGDLDAAGLEALLAKIKADIKSRDDGDVF